METKITVVVSTVDHFRARRTFKTLEGARKFAQRYVGQHPDISASFGGYAVSGDGVAKVEARGIPVSDLFPAADPGSARPEEDWYAE